MLLLIGLTVSGINNQHVGAETEYKTWVSIWKNTNLYVPVRIVITDNLDYCYMNSTKVIGCASSSRQEIRILQDYVSYVDRVSGIDIFLHEYLHIRCEWFDSDYNWHISNDNPLILKNVDYWNTCGRSIGDLTRDR